MTHCAKDVFEFESSDLHVAKISPFDKRFKLFLKKTGKEIGHVRFRMRYYKIKGRLFYQTFFNMKLVWSGDYEDKNKIIVENSAIIDHQFKLRSFRGKFTENKKVTKRKGHYIKPYFYINEMGKKMRIYFPDGIFSHLAEQYLLKHELKEIGDAVIYQFLNIATLKMEEEHLFLRKREVLKVKGIDTPVKVIRTKNYTVGYRETYWINNESHIVKKSDFNNAIIWKLEN